MSTSRAALGRGKSEIALSAYALLFSELVQYHRGRAKDTTELEATLERCGSGRGTTVVRVAELSRAQ